MPRASLTTSVKCTFSTMTHFLSRDRSRPLQSSRLTETSRYTRGAEWGWLRSTSHVVFVTRDFMDRRATRPPYVEREVRTGARQRGEDRFENAPYIAHAIVPRYDFFCSINARKRQAAESQRRALSRIRAKEKGKKKKDVRARTNFACTNTWRSSRARARPERTLTRHRVATVSQRPADSPNNDATPRNLNP